MKRKEFLTTHDLFETIVKVVKDKGGWETVAERSFCSYEEPKFITKDDFSFKFDVSFGNNEGCYITLYLVGSFNESVGEKAETPIGYIKSLHSDKHSLRKMGELGAELMYVGTEYVHDNCDRFIGSGYKIVFPEQGYSIYCSSKERCLFRLSRIKNKDCLYQVIDMSNDMDVTGDISPELEVGKIFYILRNGCSIPWKIIKHPYFDDLALVRGYNGMKEGYNEEDISHIVGKTTIASAYEDAYIMS